MRRITTILAACAMSLTTVGQQAEWECGVTANCGDGAQAPHYVLALRGGTVTQQHSTLVHGALWHTTDTTRRLSWGAGVELWGGWAANGDYARYTPGADGAPGTWQMRHEHPARAWVQQAWVQGKWRGVQLTLGAKHAGSPLLNDSLTSGDLTRSGNARPMMGIGGGFINFQPVPFTRHWLEVSGEVGYYKPADNSWLENHYNYYNDHITTGWWYNYKNIYLRSHPGKPLVVTLGMQAACQFGGTTTTYHRGVVTDVVKQKANAEAFFKAIIPCSGGTRKGDQSYYAGNHVGSWDLLLDYRLRNGAHLRAYYQSPWEDGSGIGKQNGFDGLWGLEWRSATPGWVSGAVVEYLDMTNQSGPIHWAPGDHPGTPLTTESTGMDNYYNNYAFSGYQVRGMSLGTPLLPSALMNHDGYLSFAHNVVRGVHGALMGHLGSEWRYRAMLSWRRSQGTKEQPITPSVKATSMMVEATYSPKRVPGLQCQALFALDRGKLLGDNTGVLLSVTYHGNFSLRKQ